MLGLFARIVPHRCGHQGSDFEQTLIFNTPVQLQPIASQYVNKLRYRSVCDDPPRTVTTMLKTDLLDVLAQFRVRLPRQVLIKVPVKASRDLQRFTDMLRDRYILEFPRTDNAPAGLHGIDVTIANSKALIRSTGISVPITDPRILAIPLLFLVTLRTLPSWGNDVS